MSGVRASAWLVASALCAVVPATPPAVAQSSDAEVMRCNAWTPVTSDPRGTRRFLHPFRYEVSPTGESDRVAGRYLNQPGMFQIPDAVWFAIVSEPTRGKNRVNWTPLFTVRAGTKINFYPDAPRFQLPGTPPPPPIQVRGGHMTDYTTLPFTGPYFECVKNESLTVLDDAASISDLMSKRMRPDSDRLSDRSADSASAMPDDGARFGPPRFRGDRRLTEIFTPADADTKRAGPTADSAAPAAPEKPSPPPTVLLEPAKPAPGKAEIAASACKLDTGRALPVAAGATLSSLQIAGLRNSRTEADGFDYLAVSGDAIALDMAFDIADSVDRLTAFEAVAVTRRGGGDTVWAALPGLTESRAKRSEASPKAAAPGPGRLLRTLIVGGAAEIAVSGLDLIDDELKAQSGGQIRVEAEWLAIDENGAVKPAGKFASFDKLVKAASDKAAGRRPDVLSESQLAAMFDDFEALVVGQKRPVDKVFWIKGAYPIPSSIPKRFEKFIGAVSASGAVALTPAGLPGKWLVIVTARMPGFSVAYLKEPVYSRQIGDVIEEGDTTGARRLIPDVALLATRLRTGLVAAPTAGDDGATGSAGVSGQLVLDARDIFADRGTILSPDAIAALRGHLQRVSALWKGASFNAEALSEIAGKLGRPAPTLAEIVQATDDKAYPRLPKALPDWMRKPLRDLSAREQASARAFVESYAAAAVRLADIVAAKAGGEAACSLFYVPDDVLGLAKF